MLISRKIATSNKGYLLLAGILVLISGCRTEGETSIAPEFQEFERPGHFPAPIYQFDKNPVTKEGFSLGKKLFYDPILSKDGTISCGSCHFQEAGFSDPGKALSTGINGKEGNRNAPALANLAWYPTFMADGGINHIEVMPLAPITDSLEMGETMANVILKLESDADYQKLFNQAFDNGDITAQKLLYALSQFMGMMISSESKFDKHLLGENVFSASEKRGYLLFQQNCASCHSGPLLSSFSYENNGLDMYSTDPGRERITLKEEDHGKFKVPSLKNVELTFPYMHDGRFVNLKEVIDHYTDGVQPASNLSEELKDPIVLTESEKDDMLNFLGTLTDYEYITNPMFAEGEQTP